MRRIIQHKYSNYIIYYLKYINNNKIIFNLCINKIKLINKYKKYIQYNLTYYKF